MTAKNVKFSRDQMEVAIREAGGNLSKAAEILGADRSTFYKRFGQLPSLKSFTDRERRAKNERRLDLAESNIDTKLKEGHWDATKYILRTLGSKRGLSEKLIITTPIDEPLNVMQTTRDEWLKLKQKVAHDAGLNLTK